MSLIMPGENTVYNNKEAFNSDIVSKDDFFSGAYNDNYLYYDPLIVGYAAICFTRFPSWVEKTFPNFRLLVQKNFAGFDGISDLELSTAGVTEGFAANELHVAQNLAAKANSFNLKSLMYSGSFIESAYAYWVSGIRDPRTGIATYPKEHDLEYKSFNHTAELMYVVLRPDANNTSRKIIEKAFYWTAVMPKKIAIGHFNFSKGTQNVPNELDMPFSGVLHFGSKVDDMAYKLLSTGALGWNYVQQNDFDINVHGATA